MQIFQTHQFKKRIKKLSPALKNIVDEAIMMIQKEPALGERQAGGLAEAFVYKLPFTKEQVLLAYTSAHNKLTLLTLGRVKV